MVAGQLGSGNPHGFFRSMDIDPHTLVVTFRDSIPGSLPPLSGSFFWPSTNQTGDYTVDHFDAGPAQRIRYDAFWITDTGILRYRDKYQEILHRAFGTVYAHTTFCYGNEGAHAIVFRVGPLGNEIDHEPPQIIPKLPTNGGHELSAITLVRIFAAPPGFLVATDEYSPDGQLANVLLDGAKDGNWIHPNRLNELDKTLDAPAKWTIVFDTKRGLVFQRHSLSQNIWPQERRSGLRATDRKSQPS